MHVLLTGNRRKGATKLFQAVLCVAASIECPCTIQSPRQQHWKTWNHLDDESQNLENELREHRELCEGRAGSESSRAPDPASGGRNEVHFLSSTAFPSVFFLDVNIFKRRSLKAPRPQLSIQDNIFREIRNDLDIRATVGAYFFSTATWMSIVSKKKIYEEISAFPIEMAPDVVLFDTLHEVGQ